jgi:hypothetical protein
MKLNQATIIALSIPDKGRRLYSFVGALIQGSQVPRGFFVKVAASGVKTYVLRYWVGRVEHMYTIGRTGDWTPLNAVNEAKAVRQAIDRGEDPLITRAKAQAKASGTDTVEAICKEWYNREGKRLRSVEERSVRSGSLSTRRSALSASTM